MRPSPVKYHWTHRPGLSAWQVELIALPIAVVGIYWVCRGVVWVGDEVVDAVRWAFS